MNATATTAAREALPSPGAQLFGPIHKALRHALCGLLSRLGSELMTDPEAARAVVAELERVLQLCEAHRELEDRFVYPALAARQRGSLDPFVQAHAEQPRRVAELQALGRTLLETAPTRRAAAGHTLALHFSTFTAELLVHLAEEEQLLLPLLVRTFEARELEALHHRLLASMTPGERLLAARYLLPGTDREERAGLVAAAIATAGRPALAALADLARAVLGPADFDDLSTRTGLASALALAR